MKLRKMQNHVWNESVVWAFLIRSENTMIYQWSICQERSVFGSVRGLPDKSVSDWARDSWPDEVWLSKRLPPPRRRPWTGGLSASLPVRHPSGFFRWKTSEDCTFQIWSQGAVRMMSPLPRRKHTKSRRYWQLCWPLEIYISPLFRMIPLLICPLET